MIIILVIILLLIEFNTKYTIENNTLLENINNTKGTLFIASHNYEHKDILLLFKVFSQFNSKYYMLFADKIWNNILELLRPKNIEFIYVKNETVDKISNKLLFGHNVIMFLYNETTASGPYFIIKKTISPLIIIKIRNINNSLKYTHYNSTILDIYKSNFLCKYNITLFNYNYINDLNKSKNYFIQELKYKLYN